MDNLNKRIDDLIIKENLDLLSEEERMELDRLTAANPLVAQHREEITGEMAKRLYKKERRKARTWLLAKILAGLVLLVVNIFYYAFRNKPDIVIPVPLTDSMRHARELEAQEPAQWLAFSKKFMDSSNQILLSVKNSELKRQNHGKIPERSKHMLQSILSDTLLVKLDKAAFINIKDGLAVTQRIPHDVWRSVEIDGQGIAYFSIKSPSGKPLTILLPHDSIVIFEADFIMDTYDLKRTMIREVSGIIGLFRRNRHAGTH